MPKGQNKRVKTKKVHPELAAARRQVQRAAGTKVDGNRPVTDAEVRAFTKPYDIDETTGTNPDASQ